MDEKRLENARNAVIRALSLIDEETEEQADDESYGNMLIHLADNIWPNDEPWRVVGFDECAHVARELIRLRRPLPKTIATFVDGVLSGAIKRNERGPSTTRNRYRDAVIISAIWKACQAGLNPTRNEATATISACDLVSDCLQETNHPLSPKQVATIWQNRPRP